MDQIPCHRRQLSAATNHSDEAGRLQRFLYTAPNARHAWRDWRRRRVVRSEPNRAALKRMNHAMVHRGPDGEGVWEASPDGRGWGAMLAHRRLSILDLSPAGAQPMFNADRSLAIIFNGEIYNYRELRQKLIGEGRHFQSHCDTEVLLELYAKRGEAMTEELRGMYAFAIWDRHKQGIFLVRDPADPFGG